MPVPPEPNQARQSPIATELSNWFRQSALPLAGAYDGAVRLMASPGFPGRIHFIAHAVRDIADRLIYVLDPQPSTARVQYENSLDIIEEEWPPVQAISNGAELPSREVAAIPYSLAVRIDKLVAEHRERRKRPSQYELLFRYLMRRTRTQSDANQRLVRDFKKNREWFMKLTHLRVGAEPTVDEAELQSRFAAFERMLHGFVGNFFTGIKELDDILQQANA